MSNDISFHGLRDASEPPPTNFLPILPIHEIPNPPTMNPNEPLPLLHLPREGGRDEAIAFLRSLLAHIRESGLNPASTTEEEEEFLRSFPGDVQTLWEFDSHNRLSLGPRLGPLGAFVGTQIGRIKMASMRSSGAGAPPGPGPASSSSSISGGEEELPTSSEELIMFGEPKYDELCKSTGVEFGGEHERKLRNRPSIEDDEGMCNADNES
ncbi:MAG: hypothetical protein M1816_002005 [Peltula sp. TS41687]|nr:MAG: hypothetical protein M1816_002005 [Peltula sp. TS41687]